MEAVANTPSEVGLARFFVLGCSPVTQAIAANVGCLYASLCLVRR